MATDMESLDILESKIQKLELKVYGERFEVIENCSSIIDSLLQANTIMTVALSGREKFTTIFKRLHELNDYLGLNPLSEDPDSISTKLKIILFMKEEYEINAKLMDKINELKHVLDDDKLKNTLILKKDLNELMANHLTKKERVNEINIKVSQVLSQFNEVCLEISKSFILLNDAISKLENNFSESGK